MRKLYFYLIIGIILISSACSRTDISATFDDPSCQAPCWRGIPIGAEKEDTIEKVRQMADVDLETVRITRTDREDEPELIFWHFIGDKEWGAIIFKDDRVSWLSFTLFDYRSLAGFIALYGEPEKVLLEKQSLDAHYYHVYFIYEKKGICLHHKPKIPWFIDRSRYTVGPAIHIGRVYYVDPTIHDWPYLTACDVAGDKYEYNALVQNWNGYGVYQIKNDDRSR